MLSQIILTMLTGLSHIIVSGAVIIDWRVEEQETLVKEERRKVGVGGKENVAL